MHYLSGGPRGVLSDIRRTLTLKCIRKCSVPFSSSCVLDLKCPEQLCRYCEMRFSRLNIRYRPCSCPFVRCRFSKSSDLCARPKHFNRSIIGPDSVYSAVEVACLAFPRKDLLVKEIYDTTLICMSLIFPSRIYVLLS